MINKGLDVQRSRVKGRYYYEQLAEYNQLKRNFDKYLKKGAVLPPALKAKFETYRTLEVSLRRQGII